jgi:hypothetical protein
VSGETGAWIDYFQFVSVSATESKTWSAIKSLFR